MTRLPGNFQRWPGILVKNMYRGSIKQKETTRVYWEKYYEKNKGKERKRARKYFKEKYNIPEFRLKAIQRSKDYYIKNRERLNKAHLKKRFEILMKFDFTCQYCGRKAPEIKLEVDHIIPISKGGTNIKTNLTVACWECNSGKRDTIINQ